MHITIIGCGQLARMLALEGWSMGISFSFLATAVESTSCVSGLGKVVRIHPSTDVSRLYEDLGRPDVITVEKEDVDITLLQALTQFCPVYPDPEIIEICQHRGREKAYLQQAGIDTAPYCMLTDVSELPGAIARLGFPVILKTCEAGYDGQNQWSLSADRDVDVFMQQNTRLPESVVEKRVEFSREISLLVVRSSNGEFTSYPPTENVHKDGILLTSFAPAGDLDQGMIDDINRVIERVMAAWEYVGVLAIECFVTAEGLLVNEMAPRVHNSGHWTQHGAVTSQFQNHIRAITGLAPGETRLKGYAAMVNLLGCDAPLQLVTRTNAQLHLYNKSIRPQRKVGHINLLHSDRDLLREQLDEAVAEIYPTDDISVEPLALMQAV